LAGLYTTKCEVQVGLDQLRGTEQGQMVFSYTSCYKLIV